MSTYRYPLQALAMDLVRSAVGVLLGVGGLAGLDLPNVVAAICGVLCILFGIFGVLTLQRLRTTITLTDNEIMSLPASRTVRWSALASVSLAYYSTRSDRANGWMQLVLDSGKERLKIDSRLQGFADVAARAQRAAQENGVELSERTVANFAKLLGPRSTSPGGGENG